VTRGRALATIVRGVEIDTDAYGRLEALLERQFAAALRHDAAALSELAVQITALVAEIDARRVERETICATLAGQGARLSGILPLLPELSRQAFVTAWSALEEQIVECKRLNVRNGRLLTEQHTLMQRLLRGDADTYAPA
jgi:flagella synthesis protein FlgN